MTTVEYEEPERFVLSEANLDLTFRPPRDIYGTQLSLAIGITGVAFILLLALVVVGTGSAVWTDALWLVFGLPLFSIWPLLATWARHGVIRAWIEDDKLFVRRSLGKLARTRRYPLAEIHDVRPTTPRRLLGRRSDWWNELGLYGGEVSFEFRHDTHGFGADIDERVSANIAEILSQHVERATAASSAP